MHKATLILLLFVVSALGGTPITDPDFKGNADGSKIANKVAFLASLGASNAASLVSGTLAVERLPAAVVLTTGSYANPAWITSLPWSKVTGRPTTLAEYGVTDPVALTSGSYSNPAWITAFAQGKVTGQEAGEYLEHTAPGRTMNAFAKLSTGQQLRVLGLGDSVEDTTYGAFSTLGAEIGYSGRMVSNDFYRTGGDGSNVAIANFMPLWQRGYQLDNGEYAIYSAGSDHYLTSGDTVRVLYRRVLGGGTFKIEYRNFADGTWIQLGADVDTNNASTDFQTATRTLPAAMPTQIRLTSTSGTVVFVTEAVELSHSTGGGLVEFHCSSPGGQLNELTNSDAALRRAWLNHLNPDVIMLRWYDSDLDVTIAQLKADLVAIGKATTTDLVLLGMSDSTDSVIVANLPAEIARMRKAARDNGCAFVDLWRAYNTRFLVDTVHADGTGKAWCGHEVLRQLGWMEIPRVRQMGQRTASLTSHWTIADSTSLSPGPLKLRVGRGKWKVTYFMRWVGAAGEGLGLRTTFTGESGFIWLMDAQYGTETTQYHNYTAESPYQVQQFQTYAHWTTSWTAFSVRGELIVDLLGYGDLGFDSYKSATGVGSGLVAKGSWVKAELLEAF